MVKPISDFTASPAVIASESIKPAGQSLKDSLSSDVAAPQLPTEPATNQASLFAETFFDAPLADFSVESLLDAGLFERPQWRKLSQQLVEQLASAKELDANNGHPSQRIFNEAHQVLVELNSLRKEYEVLSRLLQKP
ncbi:hypothetical protein [Spartinivicinus ruber]|uniref:hypothetical protein n=1 Tax=Spartinivicinus ruber TaxID=2683272 RepID=UPI0013D3464D|nr:hypothetical protein [Spartinivicinus ruber]